MTPWFSGVETVQGATPEWAALPFAGVTLLGDIWVFVVALTLAYWFTGRSEIAALFGVVLTALSAGLVLKLLFGLPRPATGPAVPVEAVASIAQPFYEHETTARLPGLPSGHTLGATVTWGALAALLDVWSTERRFVMASVAVVLVGLSRIVLGVHYPIDVLAGALLGVAILAIALPACRRLDDPATPLLGSAVVLGALAVVVTGDTAAANATGAAIGGLLAWQLIEAPAPLAGSVADVTLAVCGLAGIIGLGVGLGVLVGSPVGPYLGTAVIDSGVLAFPVALSARGDRQPIA
ncbi:phosphatase PAP2 family protein [Natranaeroarchaeum sulfidigenes]|uniref:Membrane-associated phospholipid phosphatase n=1 Tax=Natranaeroarchaeum sulfidigenes TaxID=2784880 RepID=A0A897MVA8_9EURY|nr:phosphatase PAP2 family protein [Natranaeroarchaeum sulfidigenes]QSG04211.1 Membrane-associated phospholipid phosphatase [Natranaeroarchaeum sulfidigenes]